jgi:post-segregation antitoxin (ccd killing protein)
MDKQEQKNPSVKRSLHIPFELYSELQEEAKKLNITVSTLIKIACSEYIDKAKKKD